jgi:hypothetical protein
MKADPDHVRRKLITASGTALLSNILPINPASAQTAESAGVPSTADRSPDRGAVSPMTAQLAEYISGALDHRDRRWSHATAPHRCRARHRVQSHEHQ